MSLLDRLRATAGPVAENAGGDEEGETERGPAGLGAREVPPLDLEVPERVQTATFSLG